MVLHEEPLVRLGGVVGGQEGGNQEELGVEGKFYAESVLIGYTWTNGGQGLDGVSQVVLDRLLLLQRLQLLAGDFTEVDSGQTFLEMRLNVGPQLLGV